ncbi:MAG: diacylglycerol/lipid kinase family protein [Litorimonas sp.]
MTNLSSSSSDDLSGAFASIFERYGYKHPEQFVGQSADMGAMMDKMRAAQGDLLVSYGGDGTAAAVASIAREQNVPFIALPGGTMNMLMLGLYGSDVWEDCLMRGLACAKARPMTAGIVRDEEGQTGTFLVGAMFGKPTQMSEAREELREGQFVEAAKGAIDAMKATSEASSIKIAVNEAGYDGRSLELINVTCPFMDGDALKPDQLDLTLFETVTGGSAISLGFAALLGNLRQSQAVETVQTPQFRLHTGGTIDALLDGEPYILKGEVTVEIDTAHGLVLAPWPAMASTKHPST